MTYALIVMLWYGSSVAVTNVPMTTNGSCDLARRETLSIHDAGGRGIIRAYCVRTQ